MFHEVLSLCLIFQLALITTGVSLNRLRQECTAADTATIIGGTHNRLVTEGGRITLTCCMSGATNGHDHEQLVWYDPNGRELSNHFANPQSKAEHVAYSVPDFRSYKHLVSMLVIQRFRLEDVGTYTCRKANPVSSVAPVKVTLDIRPRLLADYVPIEVAENNGDGTEVVAGRPAFVPLEEDRRGDIECRINPNSSASDIQITWYFQGRQLIAPSLALGGSEQRRPGMMYADGIFSTNKDPMTGFEEFATPQQFEGDGRRSVSIDPAELGIQLLNRGQLLQISRVGQRHSGTYICKAEATIIPGSIDELYEDRYQPTSSLIQMQAIRGIVFTPPRMLPGSPKEVFTPPAHESGFSEPGLMYRKRVYWDEKSYAPMLPASRYYMQPGTRNILKAEKDGLIRPRATAVVQEGGKLVLECEARGKPSPRLIWFRGGVGVGTEVNGKPLNFDQQIKQSLEYTSLNELRPQLGIQIADNGVLLPAITSVPGEETVKNDELGEPVENINTEMKTTQLGRFELSVSRRTDDTGDPVISVSRLTITDLKPSDATRYTCLALLDLSEYGGAGNFTDVGSVFPEVVLHPRFIKSGTFLEASGYPGENATITCEAFGGLPNPNGLRLRLLHGPDVPKLIRLLTGSKRFSTEYTAFDTNGGSANYDTRDELLFRPGTQDQTMRSDFRRETPVPADDISIYNNRIGNGSVRVIHPKYDPRYHLSVTSDPRNPYISTLTLRITDLKPEDNSHYACEALSGPHWRAIAPTTHEGVGRVTVWFAPPYIQVEGSGKESTSEQSQEKASGRGTVYGLLHQPSRLICQTLGQPRPVWTWTGPLPGLIEQAQKTKRSKGFRHKDYTDGELSVSELFVPAGYSNVGVFGTYSCTASNRLGSATGTIRLKLATHPGRPTMRACKVEAKLIELCVDPPEDTGGLPLTHYELRIQTHPRDAFIGPFAYLPGPRLLRLPNLIPGYYYRFALSAVSAAGRGPNAYLQVTTNRLTMPAIEMVTSPDYIEPQAYNLHWNTAGGNGPEIDQYRVSIRPVEVDYSMGEITGRPIGDWSDYTIENPNCVPQLRSAENITLCQFRVGNLRPDTAYELELSGENYKGFSEAQRIIFRTSPRSGGYGQMLNTPSYLRQTIGGTSDSLRAHLHLWIAFIFPRLLLQL